MKASQLIEKINNGEIKSGTHIRIWHTGSIKYTKDVWFHGNWFSDKPYELLGSGNRRYDDIILSLCDEYTDYEIVKDDKDIPKHLSNEFIQSFDKGGMTPNNIKTIAHKVNEVINYLQHKLKDSDD